MILFVIWLVGLFASFIIGGKLQGAAQYGVIPVGLCILWTIGMIIFALV